MRVLRRTLILFSILLTLSIVGLGQTRSEFQTLEKGFQVSKAIQKNGDPSLLVILPDKYLVDGTTFAEGLAEGLPIILGCDTFKDCKPKIDAAKTPDGLKYLFADTDTPVRLRLLMFPLASDSEINRHLIGVVILAKPLIEEKVIQN